ncbi:uncharacterized protein LOC143378861 [Andrena cerasifolii]|uniref:uncharacterized protein LOC143378861 n=1 Tax=Andrena cerasifolii TaxID=2819439 RepID=UPI0040382B67
MKERGCSTLRVIRSRPSRSLLYPPRLYIPPSCIRAAGAFVCTVVGTHTSNAPPTLGAAGCRASPHGVGVASSADSSSPSPEDLSSSARCSLRFSSKEQRTGRRKERTETESGREGASRSGRREREQAQEPARERTFVIAARVTRCPRSVATPPDARQSSVRRATVVSKLTSFRAARTSRLSTDQDPRISSCVLPRPRLRLACRLPSLAFPPCDLTSRASPDTFLPFRLHSSRHLPLGLLTALLPVCRPDFVSLRGNGHQPTALTTLQRHSSHVDRAELSPLPPTTRILPPVTNREPVPGCDTTSAGESIDPDCRERRFQRWTIRW